MEEEGNVQSLRFAFLSEFEKFRNEKSKLIAHLFMANEIKTCRFMSYDNQIVMMYQYLPQSRSLYFFFRSIHSSSATSICALSKERGVQ